MEPLALALSLAAVRAAPPPPLPAGVPVEPAKAAVLELLRGTEVPASYIESVFADPRTAVDPDVADRFNNPKPGTGEAMPWPDYRRLVVSPARIAAGRAFLGAHRAEVDAAASAYGVDPGVLAAIAGIETFYGARTGTYSVFNALYTVVNRVPRRASWGARELAALVRIAYDDRSDAHAVLGSWAGAYGYVQFMPSSLLTWGVDFDGDGRRDLYDWPDALASAANYLSRAGWPADTRDLSYHSKAWWAVYAYNHSDDYARAVILLGQTLDGRAPSPSAFPSAR
ncbi:MAG: lytic murein transglycosylase [Elusimicrobia bacterium]|nr:lytic murein transglycosylase [Elusimicrobiota bacterium]